MGLNSKEFINIVEEARQRVWNPDTLTWDLMLQPSTGGAGEGSTQVSVSGYSTQVSVSGYSTQVSLGTAPSVSQASTTWAVQVDGRVRAQNSTAADLQAVVAQASTTWAVQVDGRVRAQNSTIGDLLASVQQNSTVWQVQAGGVLRAQNSTIGDLLASVQQNSTVWQVQMSGVVRAQNSTVGDFLASVSPAAGSTWAVRPLQSSAGDLQMTATPVAGSTWNVRPLQSSQADLRITAYQSSVADFKATVAQNSTVWITQSYTYDRDGIGIESSTRVNSASTSRGLNVRSVQPDSTTAVNAANTSGDVTVISSNSQAVYVYAYSLSAQSSIAQLFRFMRGSTSEAWRLNMIPGANSTAGPNWVEGLAVTPPGYLFKTSTGQAVILNKSSTHIVHCSMAAWREG